MSGAAAVTVAAGLMGGQVTARAFATAWQSLPSTPVALTGGGAGVLPDGSVYTFGGYDGTHVDANGYVLASNGAAFASSWSTGTPLPVALFNFGYAQAPDGAIWVVGGENSSFAAVNTIYVYTPSGNSWLQAGTLPAAVSMPGVTFDSSGNLVVVGGFDASGTPTAGIYQIPGAASAYIKRASSLTVTPQNPLPSGLGAPNVLSLRDAIQVVNGQNPDGTTNYVIFQIKNNTVTQPGTNPNSVVAATKVPWDYAAIPGAVPLFLPQSSAVLNSSSGDFLLGGQPTAGSTETDQAFGWNAGFPTAEGQQFVLPSLPFATSYAPGLLANGFLIILNGEYGGTPMDNVEAFPLVHKTVATGGAGLTPSLTPPLYNPFGAIIDASGAGVVNNDIGPGGPPLGALLVGPATTITGNSIGVMDGLIQTGGSGVIGGGVTIGSPNAFINPLTGATLSVNGPITDGSNSAPSGITIGGPGTVTFTGANPYTGPTIVQQGTLQTAQNDNAGSSVMVTNGATFSISTDGGKTWTEPITLNGSGIGNAGALATDSSAFSISGITLPSDATINSGGNLTINSLGGTGAATFLGAGGNTFIINGTNTGGVVVNQGIVQGNTITGPITIGGTGTFLLQPGQTMTNPLSGNAGTLEAQSGTATWSGPITLPGTLTLDAEGAPTVEDLTGAITGTGELLITGPGTVELRGDMSGASGPINAAAGTLRVFAPTTAPLSITGATLQANQGLGTLDLHSGGVIIPADAGGAPAIVPIDGNATFDAGSAMDMILGPAGGSQLTLTGNLVLNSPTLNATVAPGFTPTLPVTIFQVPSGTITGTFLGLPQGSGVSLGSSTGFIDYHPNSITIDATPPTGSQKSDAVVTVTSVPNPSTYQFYAGVTINALVDPAPGAAGSPTGSVVFLIDGKATNPVPIGSGQKAQWTLILPSVGNHTIVASYLGDANFNPADSAPYIQQVLKAPTHTDISSTPNPAPIGTLVVLKATVTTPSALGASPTGTVTFTINGEEQPPAAVAAEVGGDTTAVLALPALPVGTYTITATYSGDANFGGSGSDPLVEQVTNQEPTQAQIDITNKFNDFLARNPTATEMANAYALYLTQKTRVFSSTPAPIPSPAARTAVASVILESTEGLSRVISAGYVEYLHRPSDAAGLAAWTSALQGGLSLQSFYADLMGSPEYLANVAGGTTTGLVTHMWIDALGRPPSPAELAQVTYLYASHHLTPLNLAAAVTGSPEFDAREISAYYQNLLRRPADAAGLQSLVAAVQGGINLLQAEIDLASSDEYFNLPLRSFIPEQTWSTLSTSANPAALGAAITLTGTTGSLAGAPTGSVIFTVDGVAQPAVTLAAGSATLALSNLATGVHTVEVSYPGDGSFLASQSGVLSEVVTHSGLTPDQAFITQLYHDLLSRAPEPDALAAWTGLLASGAGRQTVVNAIESSPERLGDVAGALYLKYLHRRADPTGTAAAAAALSGGVTRQELIMALLSSPEYFNIEGAGGFTDFVDNLYADALGRPPTAAELAYATGFFNGSDGSRASLVFIVVNSEEFYTDQSASLYQGLLGRAPDAVGEMSAADAMLGGADIATIEEILAGSDEYYNRAITLN